MINSNAENIHLKTYQNAGNPDVLSYIKHTGEVLDIGCGGGDNARILKENGSVTDGITISETELNTAGQYLRSGYLYNLEEGLPEAVKERKYDYIICSHVLEHICYPEKLLSDIKGCLKENGQLIIALPNLFHYSSRWLLMKGEFNYQSAGLWDNTHFKWYTYRTGAELLEKNGYRVIEKKVTGQLPGASFFNKILTPKISLTLYNQVKKISPGLLGYQLLYVASPL